MNWIIPLLFLLSHASLSSVPRINILMGKNLKKVSLLGENFKRTYINKKNQKNYDGLNTLTFNCFNKGKMGKEDLLIHLKTSNNLIQWDNKKFAGKFLIASKKNQDTCNVIMQTSLEKYISLILTKEMSPSWPIEALKAQAVAARSYAIYKIKHNKKDRLKFYHLENSEKHQVNGSLEDESQNTKRAARETKNEILVSPSGEVQEIFYHAHCGGKTKTPDQVWGGTLEGYTSVKCKYCQKHPRSKWSKTITLSKLQRAIKRIDKKMNSLIGVDDHNIFASSTKFYDASSRISEIFKPKLRSLLGRNFLPSSHFQMINLTDKILIEGQGNGHSVGMCQIGALEMAKKGFSYKQILAHYFPKHKIVKIK